MIKTYKVLGLFYLVMEMTAAAPAVVPLEKNNILDYFLRNAQLNVPSKESLVVKRRIFEVNTDEQLKQISLGALIGDLEKSLFASAVSANKVLTDKEVSVPEIRTKDDYSQHDVSQQQFLAKNETVNIESTVTTTISPSATQTELITISPTADSVILQTPKDVLKDKGGVTTHIVVDHITIQPHTSGLSFIPIFQLKHTLKNAELNMDHDITKTTTSTTAIPSLATAASETSTASRTTESTTTSSTSVSVSTTTTETATTATNIEQLKEAEEELQEKVAEIEAEPIILSARV